MTIWHYLLIVSLIMNFWCVAKIDKHDRSIKSLTETDKKLIDSFKECNEHTYRLFEDLLKIIKGGSNHE